jgi:hypothetical protein
MDLYGNEWSASCPGRCTIGERASCTYRNRKPGGTQNRPDREKISAPAWNQTPEVQLAGHWLYWPGYSCSSILLEIYCHVLGLCVTYKTGFGLDNWIHWHLIHSTRDYRQYSAIADLHTLQFTVTHALRFSVFTSRILATDFITFSLSLKISHEVFLHRLISYLPLFCNCQLKSFPLLPSSYVDRLESRKWTQL